MPHSAMPSESPARGDPRQPHGRFEKCFTLRGARDYSALLPEFAYGPFAVARGDSAAHAVLWRHNRRAWTLGGPGEERSPPASDARTADVLHCCTSAGSALAGCRPRPRPKNDGRCAERRRRDPSRPPDSARLSLAWFEATIAAGLETTSYVELIAW